MKKLLSLLSVLTISGTAVQMTTAASSYQKQEQLNSGFNYLQINNLENLIINKRDNSNDPYILKLVYNLEEQNQSFYFLNSSFLLNKHIYLNLSNKKIIEYNEKTEKTKNVFDVSDLKEFVNSYIILNNKIFFISNKKINEFNPKTKENKEIFDIYNNEIIENKFIINNKIYFVFSLRNIYLQSTYAISIYEFNPNTKQQKRFKINPFSSAGLIEDVFLLNESIYIKKPEFNFNNVKRLNELKKTIIVAKFNIKTNNYEIISFNSEEDFNKQFNIEPSLLMWQEKFLYKANNKEYFFSPIMNSEKSYIYEYDVITKNKKNIIYIDSWTTSVSNVFSFKNKIYFITNEHNGEVYEYNPSIGKSKKILNKFVNRTFIIGNKIYFICYNKIYQYEPLELIESDTINLQEQIKRGLYLYYQEQNPNSYVKNIEFNMNDLKYSDIELIKEEELPMQKNTENICVGETEFENSLSTEQKFKAQSCKYTRQKINSIQVIKGINKRVDNTLESGESSTDTTSTTNTNTKTTSINVGAEVSYGWGPFSVSVSTSVGNEESNTYQRENSESKTKNISKIISNSASFDLSNLKEEQEIITNELEYPSQEITVAGNQIIKVIFNLNKIIKKYKVTFKQNIDGKIKAKIKNENDEIIEQEFSIKDIMLTLKENNILPKEIIINNNLVSFIGELIVSKNSSKLKVKTEEIDAI